MENAENKDFWFEELLREEADGSAVNFMAVESKLFERIASAQEEGVLSLLKQDRILSCEALDTIEKKLIQRISEYVEYEEPVNECIQRDEELSSSHWQRCEGKLEDKVGNVSVLPKWEQILMIPEEEPLLGEWEEIESSLFNRMAVIKQNEKWEQITRQEEIQNPAEIEATEVLFEKSIQSGVDGWEQVLKSEEILAYNFWERIEEKIFQRLWDGKGKISLPNQPFWFIIDNYVSVLRKAGVITVALLLTAIGIGGIVLHQQSSEIVPTLVYQMQGASAGSQEIGQFSKNYNSAPGGAVTIVNSHGVVELQNGSSVQLSKMSKNKAFYKVNLKSSESSVDSRGKVSFLVNHHGLKECFKVFTPDYEITVKGTYFRVEPDVGNRVSTRVLEGAVKVSSKLFGDTVVRAGQSLIYDFSSNMYRIQDGGPVILRKEIDTLPNMEELIKYKVLKIRSSIPDADIRIDGRYCGTAPLIIRQPEGNHRIWVGKNGFKSVDTLITISGRSMEFSVNVNLKKDEKPVVLTERQIPVQARHIIKKKEESVNPEQVISVLMGRPSSETDQIENTYLTAQNAEQRNDWRTAISLYQQVFNSSNSSKLRREDALFSIGKLRADNEFDGTGAKEVFLTYLAMYPNGSFAGESWLRLAELEFRTNPDNAIQYYLRYFEMFPRHPRISELQNRVGLIYLQEKKYDQAISMFRQAYSNLISRESKEKLNIMINLHSALKAKGDEHNAEAVWQEYLAEKTDQKN